MMVIYTTAEQIRLWPRLLATAKSMDVAMALALEQLMAAGVILVVNDSGGLGLRPGTMPEAEYRAAVGSKESPRYPRLGAALNRARTVAHPWLPAVRSAYQDLDRRCQDLHRALLHAGDGSDIGKFRELLPQSTQRRLQAFSLARALQDTGMTSFVDYGNQHVSAYIDQCLTLRRLGGSFDHSQVSWPVDTPDGRIWVVDVGGIEPKPVDLGRDRGVVTPGPQDLVVTDWDLGQALAPVEVMSLRQREAV